MSETVAIFGGSFDPPHLAHVLTAVLVLKTCPVDRVLVIPTFSHPFAKQLTSFDNRVQMIELAMRGIDRVEISRVEEALGGESRTLRTLQHLQAEHPSWKMRFIMGADVLAEAPKWYAFDQVVALAPPIVLGRQGFDTKGAPAPILPAFSSSEIRTKIAHGEWAEIETMVPIAVVEYIRTRGLYT